MDRLVSLLDIIDQGESCYGDRFAFSMRGDGGSTEHWTYRELGRRSRIIAWRLRSLGLRPGDRLLVWTPSSPAVPALYFGAMRAGVARPEPQPAGRIRGNSRPPDDHAGAGSTGDRPLLGGHREGGGGLRAARLV
jgi:hypothetical protein